MVHRFPDPVEDAAGVLAGNPTVLVGCFQIQRADEIARQTADRYLERLDRTFGGHVRTRSDAH